MLTFRCLKIDKLFENISSATSCEEKERLVQEFKDKASEDLVQDLEFCFEVLEGKHTLNYVYKNTGTMGTLTYEYHNYTIRDFVTNVLSKYSDMEEDINQASVSTPWDCRLSIGRLVNREWRLDYLYKK